MSYTSLTMRGESLSSTSQGTRAQFVAVIPASSAPKSRQAPLKILHLCFQFLRNREQTDCSKDTVHHHRKQMICGIIKREGMHFGADILPMDKCAGPLIRLIELLFL